MKINWGTGIAIFYSLFVIAMVSMVIKSTHHKAHLVQENYYERDINYEQFRQKRQNAMQVDVQAKVQSNAGDDFIQLDFPDKFGLATGQVTLFRPSDEMLDRKYDLKLDESGAMKISLDKRTTAGRWKIQLNWEHEGRQYFQEKTIII